MLYLPMNCYRKRIPMAVPAENFLQGPETEHAALAGLLPRVRARKFRDAIRTDWESSIARSGTG